MARCNRCYREGALGFIYSGHRVICSAPKACDKRRLEMAAKDPAYLISGRRILSITPDDHGGFTLALDEELLVRVQADDGEAVGVSWTVVPKEAA